ncbi:HEAT repeat containing protein, putative, partial [Eimeria tenella]
MQLLQREQHLQQVRHQQNQQQQHQQQQHQQQQHQQQQQQRGCLLKSQDLIGVLGPRWAVDSLLPRLAICFSKAGAPRGPRASFDAVGGETAAPLATSYLQRIVVQHALPKLAGALPPELAVGRVAPLLIEGLQ